MTATDTEESTSFYLMVEQRIAEAERERKSHIAVTKALTIEIRNLRIVLASHQGVMRTLPKGLTTQGQRGGRKPTANGESARPVGDHSI